MNISLPVSLFTQARLVANFLICCLGDPTVACVWRRQTFSAAVESCTPDMSLSILYEQVPELMKTLNGKIPASGGVSILESAYAFSRMLHSSGSSSSDAFYRAFVPELGSTLFPSQIELVKRCLRSERGERDRVGATIFPGLVKVSRMVGTEASVQVMNSSLFNGLGLTDDLDHIDCCQASTSYLRMCYGRVLRPRTGP
jgi:hypothetical protein